MITIDFNEKDFFRRGNMIEAKYIKEGTVIEYRDKYDTDNTDIDDIPPSQFLFVSDVQCTVIIGDDDDEFDVFCDFENTRIRDQHKLYQFVEFSGKRLINVPANAPLSVFISSAFIPKKKSMKELKHLIRIAKTEKALQKLKDKKLKE